MQTAVIETKRSQKIISVARYKALAQLSQINGADEVSESLSLLQDWGILKQYGDLLFLSPSQLFQLFEGAYLEPVLLSY